MLDVFKQDAFSLQSLTAAINKRPYKPSRLGALKLFSESGIPTTSVVIEEKQGVLELIQSSQRGGEISSIAENRRKARALLVPHFAKEARIMADSVQGVRAFGAENELETVQNVVNQKLDTLRAMHEVTLEYQRIGALKGLIKDADGTTLFNLFTEFGVAQQAVALVMGGAPELRGQIVGIARLIEAELGAEVYSGLRAFCGKTFFDGLLGNAEVRDSFKYQEGALLRADLRKGFLFGGVLWEEYVGNVSGQAFVADAEAYVFPEGTSIFQTTFSPADYVETVNTIGLPLYAKVAPDEKWNRYVDVQAQSNPLSLCLRPRAVVKVTQA